MQVAATKPPVIKNIIIKSIGLVVEHFEHENPNHKILFITFTNYGNKNTAGAGFGGDFLLKEGFDVIAIKSSNDAWYSELDLELTTEIEKSIIKNKEKYSRVIAYGSSMGGYGAIKFSKIFQVDDVIAISPQSNIWLRDETRWVDSKSKLEETSQLKKCDFSATVNYQVIYDPRHRLDAKQVDNLRDVALDSKLTLLKLPYSGHPSGFFLSEVNLLKSWIWQIAAGEPIDPYVAKVRRKISAHFWIGIADALVNRKRTHLAVRAANEAIKLNPSEQSIIVRHERILNLSKRINEVSNLHKTVRGSILGAPANKDAKPLILSPQEFIKKTIADDLRQAGMSQAVATQFLKLTFSCLASELANSTNDISVASLAVFRLSRDAPTTSPKRFIIELSRPT
jgi:hypothetical protein